MRTVFLFMMISLDGYFDGPDHDLSWHNVDAEFNDFAIPQLKEADSLVFGHTTYDMMAGFWPSDVAVRTDPIVAGLMNNMPKIVFSKTLKTADWDNTTLVTDDAAQYLAALKQQPGKAIAILGSDKLATSLLGTGVIDELRIMVNPVVLGRGTPLFDGLAQPAKLELKSNRQFKSGNVLLTYHQL